MSLQSERLKFLSLQQATGYFGIFAAILKDSDTALSQKREPWKHIMTAILLDAGFLLGILGKSRINRMTKRAVCLAAITTLFVISAAEISIAEDDYFFSLYGGQVSDTQFNAIVRGIVDFKSYYLVAGALGKELTVYRDNIGIEVEGQIVKHIKGTEHWEFNPVLTLRWLPFPWDKKVDTSFAWGNGLSFATKNPEFEVEESSHGNRTSQILYYFMAEMDFIFSGIPNWSVFSRIHHRSSVFGLIDGIMAGSNYVTFGVRYHFN